MSAMQTTCPSCHAVFRITAQQLDARAGKVRCGKCAFVFNAFDTLVTPIETVSLMAPPPEEFEVGADAVEEEHITLQPAPPTVAEPMTASFAIPSDEQIDIEAEEINRQIAESSRAQSLRDAQRVKLSEPEPPADTAKGGLNITADLQAKLQDLQEELTVQEQHARLRRVGWGLGVVSLSLLALGQGAYFARDNLLARYPNAKPALTAFCNILRCEPTLPKNVDLIKLESYDLQTDAEHADTVVLTAGLRNMASYALAFPHLELTLTDANNQAIARRHFAPKEYLPKELPWERGMATNEEVAVKLSLQLVNLKAVGYKLLVYYP
jgi:predicted Zn finger-like uncharacterized protein